MHCRVWRPAVSLLCLAASLDAQAWLPPKGEGYVSVGYQTMFIGHHLSSFGKRTGTNDNIRSHASSIGLTYGITDRLAVAANIPYIATRYTGTTPHSHFDSPTRLDDGTYHGVFQDFRFAAHYNLWRGDVMVTPFVTLVLPSHRYDTFGHAAPGRDLREFQLGFNLGRQLRPLLPRAYTDLRYAYTFAQDVAGINTDRSNIDLEVGYFLTPRLLLRGFGMWQRSHDGLENSPNFELPPNIFIYMTESGVPIIFDWAPARAFPSRRQWICIQPSSRRPPARTPRRAQRSVSALAGDLPDAGVKTTRRRTHI